jgi:hypothetical protein
VHSVRAGGNRHASNSVQTEFSALGVAFSQ